jgi:hypothetical protein
MTSRLAAAGLPVDPRPGTVCCYARQDKVWARDPMGCPGSITRSLRRDQLGSGTGNIISTESAAVQDHGLRPVRGSQVPPNLSSALWAMSCLAYRRQIEGEVVSGAEGVGVIGAEDVAAALQCVLVQVAGGLRLAERAQVSGQVARGFEGLGMIGPEDVAAALQRVLVQVAGRLRLAQHPQIHG